MVFQKNYSPIIGTAYLAPEPGGKKFIEIGQKLKKGDTVMIEAENNESCSKSNGWSS